MNAFVRLKKIVINNIKNVKSGTIEVDKMNQDMESLEESCVLGIYGQNGSGKTAVVDVMYMLQLLLKGEKLPNHAHKYIKYGENEASVQFEFYIDMGEKKYDIEYSFSIKKVDENKIILSKEKLYGAAFSESRWENKKCILEYSVDQTDSFVTPKYRNKDLLDNMDYYIQAKVAQEFTQGYDEEKKEPIVYSLFFQKKMQSVFENVKSYEDIDLITKALSNYAKKDLIVIQNEHFGLIDLNTSQMIFHVNFKDENEQVVGLVPINTEGKNIMPIKLFEKFLKVVEQTSEVIRVLVPEVTLMISNKETKYTKDGEDGISFEIVTTRNGSIVPLECESAGIKKLISICSALIAYYNRATVCLVIDEFDSGIFEFLLGQILEIMQEYGKGQLIFTSHNLRALEVLNNESVIYTTIDPENRYKRFKYIKNTQNKRLSYLREAALGGQDIPLYHRTSDAKIKYALRKAGR